MPGTDPALTTARAESLTQRLIASAPNVLFLYAAEDETAPNAYRPSSTRLRPPSSANDLIHIPPPQQRILPDEIEDTTPLPHSPRNIRGGANVLKLQAACGFRAFAEIRLASSAIDTCRTRLRRPPNRQLPPQRHGPFLGRGPQPRQQLRDLSDHRPRTKLRRAIAEGLPRQARRRNSLGQRLHRPPERAPAFRLLNDGSTPNSTAPHSTILAIEAETANHRRPSHLRPPHRSPGRRT